MKKKHDTFVDFFFDCYYDEPQHILEINREEDPKFFEWFSKKIVWFNSIIKERIGEENNGIIISTPRRPLHELYDVQEEFMEYPVKEKWGEKFYVK